jgi:hypothetical protein
MEDKKRAMRPEIWFNAVTSVCVECGQKINGKHHITQNGHVVMRQFCPQHGHRAVLVSTDVEWFTRYEQMAAVLPPRPERPIEEGPCCQPVLDFVPDAAVETRRLLWWSSVSPGHLRVRVPPHVTTAHVPQLERLLKDASGLAFTHITLEGGAHTFLALGELLAGLTVRVATNDPGLSELAERHPAVGLVLVTRLDKARDGADPFDLAATFALVRRSPGVVAWEIIPGGKIAALAQTIRPHPARGTEGKPSNGPVPPPGPVPATLGEALPHVLAAVGEPLTPASFFPLLRAHPPGSALALLDVPAAGPVRSLLEQLDPRRHIDLMQGGPALVTSADPVGAAVRAYFGSTYLPDRAQTEAVLKAAAAPASSPKLLLVHNPLGRANFDQNRLLRACPLPLNRRDCYNGGCTYLQAEHGGN